MNIKLALITVLIASASGVFGLWYLSEFQTSENWQIVVVASLAIWGLMSFLYYRMEYMLPLAVYIGFLSPISAAISRSHPGLSCCCFPNQSLRSHSELVPPC